MEKKKIEKLVLIIVLIIQTLIYVYVGANKEYMHMDEAYSLGLASYDKVEIQDNEDFYNIWHNGEYYEDYLCVNDDETDKYAQVYENQKNDVHPPLYYLLLRIAMGFHKNSYSQWPGIIINMIIYIFVTIFMYLIIQKLLREKEKEKYKEKSIIIAFLSSIILSSITNVIYIRMYALSTLNIVITTYLHMLLLEKDKTDYKILSLIGISALVGSLTHYYYLFFLAMMFIMFIIKYIKGKKYKELRAYFITICIAGVLSLIIFPYSIKHMFFGYRGQGAISNLTNIGQFLTNICLYIHKINRHTFNGLLYIIIIAILIIFIWKKVKKQEIKFEKNKYVKYILIPTAFYFIIVAIASPWIELRYIMPICGLVFILIIYLLYSLIKNIVSEERKINIIMLIIFIIFLITPILFKMEPEEQFLDKKEIVDQLGNELNVPTIYMFNSSQNRFLDDILLFSVLDNSYIAKDIECTDNNIQDILEGKELSNGLVVFINGGQENDIIMEKITNATGLTSWKWIKGLNACNIYYIR